MKHGEKEVEKLQTLIGGVLDEFWFCYYGHGLSPLASSLHSYHHTTCPHQIQTRLQVHDASIIP